jgi:hypothetical protein
MTDLMTQDVPLKAYESNYREHLSIEEQSRRLALQIKNQETYEAASAYLLRIKDMRKRWAEVIKPAVKAAHEAHARIKDVEKVVDGPLARSESEILKPALVRWTEAEDLRRREEQERVNRELRKQEEDRKIALAEELAKSGKTELADAVLESPMTMPEVVLPKAAEVKGINYRTRYFAEVVDLKKLCAAVADGTAPLEFVVANGPWLNRVAAEMKEAVNPQWEKWGLRVGSEKIVSAGGGR